MTWVRAIGESLQKVDFLILKRPLDLYLPRATSYSIY